MKLLVISYHTSPLSRLGVMDAGGMNVYIYKLCQALVKIGWMVDVFTRRKSKSESEIVEVFENFRVINLPDGKHSLSKKELLLFVDSFSSNMFSFIKKQKVSYDLIHAHYYLSGLVGINLSKKLNIPLVQTFHTLGTFKEKYLANDEKTRISKEIQVVSKANIIITSTKSEKGELELNYTGKSSKISVIQPGVDHQIFKPKDKAAVRVKINFPTNRKLVVFVGRIDPIKGIATLIQALGDLTRAHPEFHKKVTVKLIGGDIENEDFWNMPEVRNIQNVIITEQVECCVEFVGAKKYDELPNYFSAADVVVFPSFYESFSLATLEAMAAGACVLASNVGGLQYLVKDNKTGRLFKNKNKKDLCKKLVALLADDKKRASLGKAAYEFSLKFDWDRQAERMSNVYKSLMSCN